MTPYELMLALKGNRQRRDEEMRMLAIHAAWIMNMWIKRGSSPITADRLLGSKGKDLKDFDNLEEANKYARKLREG